MPTKRTRRGRHYQAPDVPEAVLHLLEHGEPGSAEDGSDEGFEAFRLSAPHAGGEREQVWNRVKADLLEDWIAERPGTRPFAWWEFSAPALREMPARWRGAFWADTVREPRQRVGGRGTPAFEVLSVVPWFRFGIPVTFVTAAQVALYSGRGPFQADAYDPADPPRYESQANYLRRHGLLTAEEARNLPAAAFEPELVEGVIDAGE